MDAAFLPSQLGRLHLCFPILSPEHCKAHPDNCISRYKTTSELNEAGLMQLVDLVQSRLSAAIQKIPMNELDFDPDWEVDPSEIHLMDKLGEWQAQSATRSMT